MDYALDIVTVLGARVVVEISKLLFDALHKLIVIVRGKIVSHHVGVLVSETSTPMGVAVHGLDLFTHQDTAE